jgi:threonine/homoserine/homoserine lactone efflux protein
MNLMFLFLAEAVVISLSGVMAPGPVTATVVGKGSHSPAAGPLVALGHGIVEIPLMIAVFFGIGRLLEIPYLQAGIAVVGGAFMVVMGIEMLRSAGQSAPGPAEHERSPLAAGILLSLGNPYFLVWWATVGAALIVRSFEFGLIGFVLLAAAHWLCDLVWSTFLSVLAFKGGQFFGRAFQRAVFVVCGILLLVFSVRLVAGVVQSLLA